MITPSGAYLAAATKDLSGANRQSGVTKIAMRLKLPNFVYNCQNL